MSMERDHFIEARRDYEDGVRHLQGEQSKLDEMRSLVLKINEDLDHLVAGVEVAFSLLNERDKELLGTNFLDGYFDANPRRLP